MYPVRKKRKIACVGLAAAIGVWFASSGMTAFAAPSLSRPGADVAAQVPRADIGVEDMTPHYVQDDNETHFTVENFVLEAPDLDLDKDDLTEILEGAMGSNRTIADLRQTVDRLTVYCRTHGSGRLSPPAREYGRCGRSAHHSGAV